VNLVHGYPILFLILFWRGGTEVVEYSGEGGKRRERAAAVGALVVNGDQSALPFMGPGFPFFWRYVGH
jgi:hypothetical protein